MGDAPRVELVLLGKREAVVLADGKGVLYVRARNVWHPEPVPISPVVREVLLGSTDWWTDHGWSPDVWFLVDCATCGAEPWQSCRGRRGAPIQTQHRRLERPRKNGYPLEQ